MRVLKPITDAKWTFEIIDGPSKFELVNIAICNILDTKCEIEFFFELNRHPYKWIGKKIRTRIIKIEKSGEDKWIIIGDWLDAKFKARPCSFKAEYSSSSKTGKLVFSFEYGQLSIVAIDSWQYKSFR